MFFRSISCDTGIASEEKDKTHKKNIQYPEPLPPCSKRIWKFHSSFTQVFSSVYKSLCNLKYKYGFYIKI